ncbi:type VII secretion system-associated protein [Amycolatopsis sp. NPDC059021]|uniref:type VII secretion system-associated protein n=1 Tax=Amycolatopsis sp. NPDC059021 TaxID=3346704 RepID=UPI003670A69A
MTEDTITTSSTEVPLRNQWVLMVDTAWQPTEEQPEPPDGAVVGAWFIEQNGTTGHFRPNPGYEPSEPGLPTDPVDANLQLVARGEAEMSDLLAVLPEIYFGLAVDETGLALIESAPDGVPCLLATTAPAHRRRVDAHDWVKVTVKELADAGVDVLLNPGAPASRRVPAASWKALVDEYRRIVMGGSSPDDGSAEDTR